MFTVAPPYREIALTKFGGLYTEAPPENLPPGASPQNWDVDYLISKVGTRPGLSLGLSTFSPPLGAESVEWLKSAQLLGPKQYTIMQDAGGGLWYEDIVGAPGTMTRFYSPILNGARAVSTTVDGREYIPLSDLTGGSDQPRQYDGVNNDRISQVGPGQGPSVPVVAAPSFPILSITEIWPTHTINSISWGATINLYNAQPASTNLFFLGAPGSTAFLTGLNIGDIVYVSSCGNLNGQNPNGTYTVIATGSFTDVDGTYQYFEVQASVANSDFARGTAGAGAQYQKTQALIQLSTPIPLQDAVVGMTITITGATPSQWDGTWTIVATPTEGQLLITATSLTSNVATYTYSLVSGEAPGWQPNNVYAMGSQIVSAAGDTWQVTTPGTSGGSVPSFLASPQTDNTVTWTKESGVTIPVTVFNTSNGNGIFNVQNATITSATATTFTIALTGANVASAPESGSAVSGSGSVLIIDPGLTTLGTGNPGTNPIFGNGTGGSVLPTRQLVAPGQRYCVLMFKTRSGYITSACPPVSFFTTGQSNQLTFKNLALGPPNVIARIVAITLANAGIGGPYFWVPNDVILPGSAASLGETTTVNKTILNDDTSTSFGPITINDAVLAESINITEDGNNLLLGRQRELGECVKAVQWAGRVFYLGERTKNDELINMTFDGGSVAGLPAGWAVPSGLVSFVSLITSQVFGQSLKINNTSGSTMNPTGTGLSSILALSQTAYLTAFQSPITEPSTAYSLRVTCANPSGATQGALVVEFYSASLAQNWPVTVALSSMQATLSEFILPFNNPLWQPVPTDLQLRVYLSNVANNVVVVVDRMEVFLTMEPFYTKQVAASYAVNPEAVDAVTGAIDTSILTSQPQTNHFEFLDRYYITCSTKTFSPVQGTSEPGGGTTGTPPAVPWTVNEVSNAVGSLGPMAVDVGEEYVLVGAEDGAYIFDGGNHIKISQEIQKVWDLMYRPAKNTVWIKNDLTTPRILVGLPLPTPNAYLPNAPANPTPSQPNVVLMCSVIGLPSGAAIADGAPVTISAFTGNLIFHDSRRKWSIWQIPAGIADFINRPGGTRQLWFGQLGQISKLDASATSDNGVAIASRYVTFPFSDMMDNDRLQLGNARRLFPYSLLNVSGAGSIDVTLTPENLLSPYSETQPAFDLAAIPLDDLNVPFNETGNRAFLQVDSDGVAGTTWQLNRVVMAVAPDPRMLITGQ